MSRAYTREDLRVAIENAIEIAGPGRRKAVPFEVTSALIYARRLLEEHINQKKDDRP